MTEILKSNQDKIYKFMYMEFKRLAKISFDFINNQLNLKDTE